MSVGAMAAAALPPLFKCDRLQARMTVGACAKMYRSAEDRPPQIGESRAACVGCEIGARHAGRDIEVARRAARAAELDPVCASCGATGRRMVGGLRCISCYNRAAEARRGRDARGRPPRFATLYHCVSLVLVTPTGLARRDYPGVTGRAEALILAAKQSGGGEVAIGWRRLAPLPAGAALDLAPDFAPRRGQMPRPRRPLLVPGRALIRVPQLELAFAHG